MQPPDTLPPSWQRLLALSGVVADDNQWKSRIGAFAMLLAGFGSRTSPGRANEAGT